MAILLLVGFSANAQTLKETLFSGKLKTDTGTVIRKGEDLSSKIDTSRKIPLPPDKKIISTVTKDSITGVVTTKLDTVAVSAANVPPAVPKDNNKIWKDFITELTNTLKTDVLTSDKIKKGIYSVLIEYEIGLDGQIGVNKVSCEASNSYLESQVKERIILSAPQMTPLLGVNGKPRIAAKKQTIILTK
ncbi:MAG TPA: hypothetical protein VLJ68_07400 [Chitinophagaceae bacterium]|nr:hypothetical protein [Chitinophagaceae bacterium]